MPRRPRLTIGRLLVVAAGTVLALGTCLEMQGTAGPETPRERVLIPRGASVRTAAESLAVAGVIGSTRLFRWYAALDGRARAIKPGTYDLPTGSGYRAVLDALVAGDGVLHTVVIPEGFDLRDITPLLAKALEIPEDSVTEAVTDPALRQRLDIPTASVEGYLFPATYAFPIGTSAREAVAAMVARWEAAWDPAWDARLSAMGITRHEAMTMASIVEKEARKAEERPIIAAVYWNRVKRRMRLQADPTVQYALPQHVDRVLYRDLTVDSRYNTYRYDGLPPGPIASPGRASLAAALEPANVPYLFFVARPDGSHRFTTTFQEHARAIREIRSAVRRGAAPAVRQAR